MSMTHDILTEDGKKLLTCINDNGNISFQGKNGTLDLNNFMWQVYNPATARKMKIKK